MMHVGITMVIQHIIDGSTRIVDACFIMLRPFVCSWCLYKKEMNVNAHLFVMLYIIYASFVL